MTELIEQYTPLVKKIARQRIDAGSKLPLEDLVQEGYIALLEASKKFDPDHPRANFVKYAARCIKHHLIAVSKKHQRFPDQFPDDWEV